MQSTDITIERIDFSVTMLWRTPWTQSPSEKRQALIEKVRPALMTVTAGHIAIPPHVQEAAAFGKQQSGGETEQAPVPTAEFVPVAEQPSARKPAVSAEAEVAATAPFIQIGHRLQETPPASPEHEEAQEEQVMVDCLAYWKLSTEIRTLEGEKALREKALEERREMYKRLFQDVQLLVSHGGDNPGPDMLGSAAEQLKQAQKNYRGWLSSSKYLDKRNRFEELTDLMRRYFPYL